MDARKRETHFYGCVVDGAEVDAQAVLVLLVGEDDGTTKLAARVDY